MQKPKKTIQWTAERNVVRRDGVYFAAFNWQADAEAYAAEKNAQEKQPAPYKFIHEVNGIASETTGLPAKPVAIICGDPSKPIDGPYSPPNDDDVVTWVDKNGKDQGVSARRVIDALNLLHAIREPRP